MFRDMKILTAALDRPKMLHNIRLAGFESLRRSMGGRCQRRLWAECAASFLIDAAEARSVDMCSYKKCSSRARHGTEQVGLPGDARLTRQNAPENGAIKETDQQRRAQRDRRAIHQAARHEEAEPAEDQP
jgi:hypothetical protein